MLGSALPALESLAEAGKRGGRLLALADRAWESGTTRSGRRRRSRVDFDEPPVLPQARRPSPAWPGRCCSGSTTSGRSPSDATVRGLDGAAGAAGPARNPGVPQPGGGSPRGSAAGVLSGRHATVAEVYAVPPKISTLQGHGNVDGSGEGPVCGLRDPRQVEFCDAVMKTGVTIETEREASRGSVKVDTRIHGGEVMVGSTLCTADILVHQEKILGVVSPDNSSDADVVIDARGRTVLPGIIDLHAHTREPGYTHKEDFLTASQAAAVGGVTTIVDMPNVEPPTDSVRAFEDKRAAAAAKSIVDWGHFVAATNLGEISALAEAGATGYKVFQVSGAYPHDPRLAINDDGALLRAMRAIVETGLPMVVHPFNQSLFDQLSEEAFVAGRPRNWRTFAEIYTAEEIWHTAVSSLINLQRLSGVRLHLLHSHSASSLRLIRAAKAAGQRITCAIDPKYYQLTRSDLERGRGRVCPGGFVAEDPGRMEEIWQSLNDGTIDIIDSDHAPHTLEEVAAQDVNAWDAAMGSPQYDWHYSIVLNDVHAGRISLSRAVQLLCETPARILGIFPRKGALLPGSDADLVLVDRHAETTLDDRGLYTKAGWTPYSGWTLKGLVTMTMLRGTVIASGRRVVGSPGYGRYIPGRPQYLANQ